MTDRSSPPAQVPTRPRCRPGKCYPPPRDIRSQERPHGRTSPAVALCPLECMGKAAGVVRWRKLQEHGRPAGGRCRGEGCQPASLHARIVRRPYSYAPMDISARATATSRRLGLHARRSSTSCCLLLLHLQAPGLQASAPARVRPGGLLALLARKRTTCLYCHPNPSRCRRTLLWPVAFVDRRECQVERDWHAERILRTVQCLLSTQVRFSPRVG